MRKGNPKGPGIFWHPGTDVSSMGAPGRCFELVDSEQGWDGARLPGGFGLGFCRNRTVFFYIFLPHGNWARVFFWMERSSEIHVNEQSSKKCVCLSDLLDLFNINVV